MVKLAFCDTETVRLASDQGSALWELCIVLREDGKPDDERLWQVRPDLTHASAGSLGIGGYYGRCEVQDKPVGSGAMLIGPKVPAGKKVARAARLIAHDAAKLLDGALIVGANPWFDAGHIDAFLREYGQALAADYHMRDLSSVVAGYLAACSPHDWAGPGPWPGPLTSSKLTDIARAVGIDPDKYKTHTAHGDARLGVAIWDRVFA